MQNTLFKVEGEGVKITVKSQYILTSAHYLIASENPEFLNKNTVDIQGNIVRQTRPKNWDIKGWIKLFKEIKKYLPEEGSLSVQGGTIDG